MNTEVQILHTIWKETRKKSLESTILPDINFDNFANSIISLGPFYFYVVDFYDMSISNVSHSIEEIHGFPSDTVTFDEILSCIHTDDVDFIGKAEAAIADFFYTKLSQNKLLKYKMNYSFRAKMKDGTYALMNHQALMLTVDSAGRYGKSLNIHTRIDHLTTGNTYQFSLIGLDNEPSFLNLNTSTSIDVPLKFSKREIEIIRHIAEGTSNSEIAEKLFISILTVKKHRNNIMKKSQSKNTAQLVKTCVLQGLI